MSARFGLPESVLHMSLALLAVCLTLFLGRYTIISLQWLPAAEVGRYVQPQKGSASPVIDATGASVARGEYRRLVVLEGLDLVLNLVPESRVVAVDDWSVTHSIEGWRVADRPRISDHREIEAILASHPDLVIAGTMGNPEACEAVEQVRAAGIPVFDLGYIITIYHLCQRVVSLGALLQVPNRAERLQEQLRLRVELTCRPPASAGVPKRALFLCAAGDGFTVGGGADVFQSMLLLAGLRNTAAEAGIAEMPLVTLETPLKLNPRVLVVRARNHRAINESELIQKLDIEATAEIPGPMLGVAAPIDLVDTAESLHDQIYCRGKRP